MPASVPPSLPRCVFLLWLSLSLLSAPLRAGFKDEADQAGLNPTLTGETVVESPAGVDLATSGNALCAADLDGDGLTDLLCARNNRRPLFFRNLGNGTFAEEGIARGLGNVFDIGGIAAGDLANRGAQDVVMVPRYGDRYFLFVNDGTGHFTERALERGADVSVKIQMHKGQSVSLVDYDLDGFLDIHVAEWGVETSTENARHAVLLRNRGRTAPGFFDNVTASTGLLQPHFGTVMNSFVSAWGDFDRDGLPDVYITSDYGTSQLFWNQGDGTFLEGRAASRVGSEGNGMGIAIADVNRDGLPDVFVSSFDNVTGNLIAGNKLYLNEGSRRFRETARGTPIEDTSWSWGSAFLDANNDGNADLLVTNGYKYYSAFQQSSVGGVILNANTDKTKFFLGGASGLADASQLWGVNDALLGRSVVVLDSNNDGYEDVLISNTDDRWILYRNDRAGATGHWVRFSFRGTQSNRDGYGAEVSITAGGRTQFAIYAPTNAYIGQREPVLHFGLGSSGILDTVKVRWPSGVEQTLTAVAADRTILLEEPASAIQVAPAFVEQPAGGSFSYGSEVRLTARASGSPAPLYSWFKDGVALPGAAGATLVIHQAHPYDAGNYTVVARNAAGETTSAQATVSVTADLSRWSVARWWDEEILEAIRRDTPNPPVHARNLYHFSSALWDAFWAFERVPDGTITRQFFHEAPTLAATEPERRDAQARALSHAAFTVIKKRYAKSPGAARTLANIRWLMQQYGFDPDDTRTTGDSPAALGNRIGQAVLAATLNDGANEANGYADATGYKAVNAPLVPILPGTTMADPNRWQPLSLSYSISQNGLVQPGGAQPFVGVNARRTTPFALAKTSGETIALDPGSPPQLGGSGHETVVADVIDVIRKSAALDPSEGETIDVSPAAMLHNPLGTNEGVGRSLNPATGKPYAPNRVLRGDYARILAEYWADGPNSETPPGHWNVLFNDVSDHPATTHRYGGLGPVLPRLEWDVRGYLALNGSLHDAACAAWTLKRQYDGVRPLSLIRHMAVKGQSSDPAKPRYHAQGLPLVPGLIEQTTAETLAPGGRHAAIVQRTSSLEELTGKIVIKAWRGNPLDPKGDISGVGWILAENWVPYQRSTFVTPAFPGFISGHSTFSRTAAEVLTLLTGSPFFPGGMSSRLYPKNNYLEFESGPSADVTLQWATFYDAADQAGLSRLYGGIHPSTDDLTGRRLGSRIGLEGFLKAHTMHLSASEQPRLVNLSVRGICGTADKSLILGIVTDSENSTGILARAIGPSLAQFGIPANRCSPDPNLRLYSALDTPQLLGSNDQWSDGPESARVLELANTLGAFPLAPGSRDAAALLRGPAGGYTVVTEPGSTTSEGVNLVEVYGANLLVGSARGYVGRDVDVLVLGMTITGRDMVPVLVRGIGPSLQSFGVRGTVADPQIRVHRLTGASATEVGFNDSWLSDDKASLAQSAGGRVGAFPVSDSKEAMLFLQLEPGNYTMTLSGTDGATGVGIIEVYLVR
ncbi:FG-GAP-like repeat-containing protein [Nibricoccus sp. IMCC34717]|uniref:FG-GAP-like repeat-containing protein n=1 Tax=Nibricoccus sp. IMCC34717 TaxID=3034021 RepID=UPI00384F7865